MRVAAAALAKPMSATTPDNGTGRQLESDDPDAPGASGPGRFYEVATVLSEWSPPSPKPQVLTRREYDVVRLMLAGGRVSSIAEDLGIAPDTVRNHLHRIFAKLGVHSQVELVREMSKYGTTDEPRRVVEFPNRR